jgi:hypothetical protein
MGGLFCGSSSIRGKVSIEIDRPFQLRSNGSLTGVLFESLTAIGVWATRPH